MICKSHSPHNSQRWQPQQQHSHLFNSLLSVNKFKSFLLNWSYKYTVSNAFSRTVDLWKHLGDFLEGLVKSTQGIVYFTITERIRARWLVESYGLWEFSINTLMIIENGALWLARSFASSCFNHRAVIVTLKALFKMAARFFDVSESEIDQ